MIWASIQSLPASLGATGSVTVVGVLLVAVFFLWRMHLRYIDRLEQENKAQHEDNLKRDEENRQLVRDVTAKLSEMCRTLQSAEREREQMQRVLDHIDRGMR